MSEIEFGFLMPHGATSAQARSSYLADCERNFDMGRGQFKSIWMSDHLQVNGDVLECWTTLAYLAGRYADYKFGAGVICQSYRNPALLAKMAATFQYITGGRLLLGIGAGWKEDEYHAYNYPFPAAGQRVSELEETVQIVKAMWTQEETTFAGKYHQVHSARCDPHPDTAPALVLAAAHNRTLHMTARYADWWDVTGSGVGRDDYPALAAEMDRILAEEGRDPSSLIRSYTGPCGIAADTAAVNALSKLPPGKGIVGTPDQVVEQLQSFIKHGVTHFQLVFVGFPDSAPLELFMQEVMPQIQAG